MIVVFAEKPDVGTKLAAILGGCMIGNKELTLDKLKDNEFNKQLEKEKYDKGYLISSYNGKHYVITWGYGHMCELKDASEYDQKYKIWHEEDFPFIPKRYSLKIKDDKRVKKQFPIVKGLFNNRKAEYIICACDDDREGSLVFSYTYQMTGSKKECKYLCIQAFTEKEIKKAFDNLKSESEMYNVIYAARCRDVADFLIGANLTAVATIKYGSSKDKISIGRVLTPVLTMLVEKEKQIINFESEKYWEIEGKFQVDNGKIYAGKWKNEDGNIIKDLKIAEEIVRKLESKNGYIKEYEEGEYNRKPPLLYDLTALQMDTNSKYGMTAKKTLEAAEKLYLNQYISYPRTKSHYVYTSMVEDIKEILKALPDIYKPFVNAVIDNVKVDNTRVFDDEKIEGHFALIPTTKAPPEDLPEDEVKVYGLIARSIIKAFMSENKYKKIKFITKIHSETFVTRHMVELQEGWKQAEKRIDIDNLENSRKIDVDEEIDGAEEELKNYEIIKDALMIDEGNIISNKGYTVIEKTTKHPARYTEKSLLYAMQTAGKIINNDEMRDALKDRGIGTPATRADIIERLIKLGYIERCKRTLKPTEKGMMVIEKLPLEEVKSVELTGDWECKLNEIENGKIKPMEFYKSIKDMTEDMTEKLKAEKVEIIKEKEVCSCPMPGCTGKIIKNKKGYGCSEYDNGNGCKFYISKCIAGKEITESVLKVLVSKGETGMLSGFISSRTGKKYSAKLILKIDKETNEYKLGYEFPKITNSYKKGGIR